MNLPAPARCRLEPCPILCLSYVLYRSSYKGTTLATRIRRRRPVARSTCDCLLSVEEQRGYFYTVKRSERLVLHCLCERMHLYVYLSLYGLITVELGASITTRPSIFDENLKLDKDMKDMNPRSSGARSKIIHTR